MVLSHVVHALTAACAQPPQGPAAPPLVAMAAWALQFYTECALTAEEAPRTMWAPVTALPGLCDRALGALQPRSAALEAAQAWAHALVTGAPPPPPPQFACPLCQGPLPLPLTLLGQCGWGHRVQWHPCSFRALGPDDEYGLTEMCKCCGLKAGPEDRPAAPPEGLRLCRMCTMAY